MADHVAVVHSTQAILNERPLSGIRLEPSALSAEAVIVAYRRERAFTLNRSIKLTVANVPPPDRIAGHNTATMSKNR